MVIYSWRTKKIGSKFKYEVTSMTSLSKPNKQGFYANTRTIKSGVMKTRARAKGIAQKWVAHFKQIQRRRSK